MKNEIYLSLCIPTNGVIEWVVPVIESIYAQECDSNKFEVIVTDNGSNDQFRARMLEYVDKYSNFIYQKTDAFMFLNQIEAFKLAKGYLIKFVNHRMTLMPRAVNYLVSFAQQNTKDKPVVYFSNGVLNKKTRLEECNSFDGFVRTLSYWSSWSGGTAIWKRDFENIDLARSFNKLFPHTDIVFFNKTHDHYVIDDTVLMDMLPTDETKKGNYDLFNAFAVEYPAVLNQLYIDKYISRDTYEYVKKQNGIFVSDLYLNYIIRKKACSYRLDGYRNTIGKYYSDWEIKCGIFKLFIKKGFNKLRRIVLG